MGAGNDMLTEQINPLVMVGDTPLRTSSARRLSRSDRLKRLAQLKNVSAAAGAPADASASAAGQDIGLSGSAPTNISSAKQATLGVGVSVSNSNGDTRWSSGGRTLAQPQPAAVTAQGRNVILPGDFQGRAIAQPSQPTAVAHGRPGSISETKTDDNGVVGRGADSAQKARSSRRPSAADTPRGTRVISFPRFLRAAENYHGTTAYVV